MNRYIIMSGCSLIICALLLLPIIWIGIAYDYNASEWLSLLEYPKENDEFFPWVFRICLISVIFVSTMTIIINIIKSKIDRG